MSMKKKSNWNLGCSLVLVVVIVASFLFYGGTLVNILCSQESR